MKKTTVSAIALLTCFLISSCMESKLSPTGIKETNDEDTIITLSSEVETIETKSSTTTETKSSTTTNDDPTTEIVTDVVIEDTQTMADVEGYLSAIDTSTLEGAIRKAYLSEHRTLIESGDADLIGADVVYSDEDAAAFFITGMAGADIPSYEVAGERYFIYGQSRYLLVYRDGAILHINTAYDTDVISGQFLEAVYSEYRAKNPSLYEDFDKEGAAALTDSMDITYKGQ